MSILVHVKVHDLRRRSYAWPTDLGVCGSLVGIRKSVVVDCFLTFETVGVGLGTLAGPFAYPLVKAS